MTPQDIRFADRFEGITGSAIREIFKLIAKPDMISFAGGNPAASALENERIAELAQQVLLRDGKRILQYGATEGWPELREACVPWLRDMGVEARAEDILPVSGSTQTVDLVCKAMINPGDVILVENPSFLGAFQTMRLYQARLEPVPTDEGGVIPEALEEAILRHKPRLIYLIPNFQNPTGVTLARERRPQIAALAAKYGVAVMEDDPYRDLRYLGEPLPTIKSFDEAGWVIYMASFSKLISPGIRVGAVTAHPTILRKLTIGKQSTDLHVDQLAQAVVAEYLNRGWLPEHVREICQSYRAQLLRMLEGLDRLGIEHTNPEGGLFVWARLAEGLDAPTLLERAVERHVAFVPGTHFYCDGGRENTLRLNFSNSPLDKIDQGMQALGEAIASL